MAKIKLVNIKSAINGYTRELIKRGIQPEEIILYGSHARGTATPDSDLDLIVISDDFASIPPMERLRLLSHAAWPVHACIEAQGFTSEEIREHGKESILWDIVQQSHKILFKAA